MIKYSVRKNGIITNSWTSDFADESHYEPCFGKPERWVLHKDEPMAEAYDDADVLEERTDELDGVSQKMVKLRAEYTISIEDITAEHELQQVIAARKAEYPSPEEFMNAFFDGGEEAIEQLRLKRLEIKSRHPKP